MHYAEPSAPENLLAIVRTIVESDAEARKVVDASKGDEAKKRLSENTQRSFDEGAFGLPWFVGMYFLDARLGGNGDVVVC